jgi:hypothetical protein
MASKIKRVKRGKGGGKVFTAQQIKDYLNGELFELAKLIKEFMIAEAEKGGKHKFRADGKAGIVQSTKVEFTVDGVEIELAEHAQYINNGRKAGAKKVPIGALIKWLKRYRVVSRDKKTGKYQKSSEGSINAAAYAIQQSIFKNGIKARPFIEKTLDFAEDLISEVIDEIMIPEIISIIEFTFKK